MKSSQKATRSQNAKQTQSSQPLIKSDVKAASKKNKSTIKRAKDDNDLTTKKNDFEVENFAESDDIFDYEDKDQNFDQSS